ncbi:MAG: DUF4380 domain-containing protein [Planctomycetota bacterium]
MTYRYNARRWAWGLVAVLLMLGLLPGCRSSEPVAAPAAPKPLLTFDDKITLDNGKVRLGVSPAVGRVVEFGFTGGENLIWVDTEAVYDNPVPGVAVPDQKYYNLGGDKLWPTAQPLWKLATGNDSWPPDGVIDGGPWTVRRRSDRSVTIESAPSPHYGIVVLRTFTLAPDEPRVVIQNLIHRVEANPIPVSAWTITQVKTPIAAVLDVAADGPEIAPLVRPLTDDTPGKVAGNVSMLGRDEMAVWKQRGDTYAKLGTFGRSVAAVYDDVTFLQETDFNPAGAYPEMSSAQLYRAGDYVELELLSPLVQLGPEEVMKNQVVWTLIDVSSEHAFPTLLNHKRK